MIEGETDFSTQRSGIYSGVLWSDDLDEDAPGYDEMWTILPGYPRHKGWYKGVTTSINGIYHNGGDQNPIIPYRGKLYTHRSNAIIAYGPAKCHRKGTTSHYPEGGRQYNYHSELRCIDR